MARVRCGTSGYDYDPWVGAFYPEGLPRRQRLSFYASQFPALEINATFYRKPSEKALRGWAAQVPEDFRFALKAWQRITHFARLRSCDELVRLFGEAAALLAERLGPVLYQLPPNLKKDVPLLSDFLALLPAGQRAAFEFRHSSWFGDDALDLLRRRGCTLCVAETEEEATPLQRTAAFGYFRLRRLDYDERVLAAWAERIASAGFSEDVYVFFKHEDAAKGPGYARQFAQLINA